MDTQALPWRRSHSRTDHAGRSPAGFLCGFAVVWLLSTLGSAQQREPARGFSVPQIDLSEQAPRQVVVDSEPGQYLGHPSTLLLEDGKTVLCVYPKGHGRGPIVLKRSEDGGQTWSSRLPVPASWATSLETPTIHRVIDPEGRKRIILWSGLYPARFSLSEDNGVTWSELKPAGAWGGIVVMGSVVDRRGSPGEYLALFHDDGRFILGHPQRNEPVEFSVYKTFSHDGGLTWSSPEPILRRCDVHLCEPGAIRSPDGRQIAVLLRENSRRRNSHLILSEDEGVTWSEPRELLGAVTGDRHTARYLRDGRLFISFRDMALQTPSHGDWVAWVGTYQDLLEGREGDYRIRLKDNLGGSDCAYPGVEVLPDGTVLVVTYGHWAPGAAPYILSVRLGPDELEKREFGRCGKFEEK